MNAYACKLDGELLLNTVFPTARGAMVNFIGTQTSFMPKETWSEETIKDIFGLCEQSMNVKLIEVEVVEKEFCTD